MIGKQRSLHLDTRFLSLSKIADGGNPGGYEVRHACPGSDGD